MGNSVNFADWQNFSFLEFRELHEGILENCGALQTSGNDFEKIWRYATLHEVVLEKYGVLQISGNDFEKIWRYAALHEVILKKMVLAIFR